LASLRHPNIVPLFDFAHSDQIYYLVMEYINGTTLKDEMQTRHNLEHPFTPADIVNIFGQLCGAVDYAHSRGMVHRDLKPVNVMLTPQGRVVLTDFGIASIVDSTQLTATGAFSGTPAYMSPEQGQGQRVDARSDIYTLGIILYELNTETVPYDADTLFAVIIKHIDDPLPLPTQVNPNLPESVERVILKSLSKAPSDRYPTAAAMAQALQVVMGVEVKANTAFRPIAPPIAQEVPGAASAPRDIMPPASMPSASTPASIPPPLSTKSGGLISTIFTGVKKYSKPAAITSRPYLLKKINLNAKLYRYLIYDSTQRSLIRCA